jgi:hypothetical protein
VDVKEGDGFMDGSDVNGSNEISVMITTATLLWPWHSITKTLRIPRKYTSDKEENKIGAGVKFISPGPELDDLSLSK